MTFCAISTERYIELINLFRPIWNLESMQRRRMLLCPLMLFKNTYALWARRHLLLRQSLAHTHTHTLSKPFQASPFYRFPVIIFFSNASPYSCHRSDLHAAHITRSTSNQFQKITNANCRSRQSSADRAEKGEERQQLEISAQD